ncbi:KDSR family protein [Megaselia abdita]
MSVTSLEIYFFLFIAILVHILVYLFVKNLKSKEKSLYGKHVVVTGGSSGIGLNIATECAKRGANVTIIARNENTLNAAISLLEIIRRVPEQKFQKVSLDISKDYKTVEKVFEKLESDVGPIYMLVNCAGMAICGVFEEVSVEDAHKLMDVNYFGTYNCTRCVLPKMKAAKEGVIVITASQAALMGIYGYGCYAAAKFALRGLAETIAMESKHLGVTVTLAMPADTNTPGFENEEKSKPKETKIISGSGGLAKPEDVASQIVKDALNGSFFSILGTESWILSLLCCGMAPWGGIGLNIFQAIVMGPLRLIGCAIQYNFSRIIRQCALESEKQK